jgi:nicotinamidase-related amidase
VVHTRVEYSAGGADGGLFYKKVAALSCFDRGNPLAEPPQALRPNADEVVVTKQYASAFFGTSLASTLRAIGCDSVVVTGVSTSGCVRASALDTLQSGFIPLVVEDACGDRNKAVHDANIFDLGAKYADIVKTATVLNLVRSGWAS